MQCGKPSGSFRLHNGSPPAHSFARWGSQLRQATRARRQDGLPGWPSVLPKQHKGAPSNFGLKVEAVRKPGWRVRMRPETVRPVRFC